MFLSASRRTDIPCYYSEWFLNRIRAGYVLTRNPMNSAQLYRIPLSPATIDCIVFWTKDAANILPYLDELDGRGYMYYFQFTLTPYDRTLEAKLRPKGNIEDAFIALSKRIGAERVVWRYDPIILNDTIDIGFHKREFLRMCDKLSKYTDTVTVSFVDMYAKLKSPLVRPITPAETGELAAFIGNTAAEHGLRVVACCESGDLRQYGIAQSSCIDKERVERLIGCPLEIKADKNQRAGCGCCESIDIGAYNTCLNGCVYCYANDSVQAASRRHMAHDPSGELLLGKVCEGERVILKETASNKRLQTRLF